MSPGNFSLGGKEGGREKGREGERERRWVSGFQKRVEDGETRPRCLIKGKIGGRKRGDDLLMRTQRHMLGAFMQEMLVRLINYQPGPRRLTKRGNVSKEGLGVDGTGGVAGRS